MRKQIAGHTRTSCRQRDKAPLPADVDLRGGLKGLVAVAWSAFSWNAFAQLC
jgi:hypothetical protein